jgi:REP element-mobilizing transposase RayT
MTLKGKYEYRRKLPHLQNTRRPIFVTFNTKDKWVLSPKARDIVLEACLHANGKRIDIEAMVVMPDHVHVLFWTRRDKEGTPYTLPEIMQAIKGTSAHKINELLNSRGPVWQPESFDYVLRKDEDIEEYSMYIRLNPVRRALVKSPSRYKWLWIAKKPIV